MEMHLMSKIILLQNLTNRNHLISRPHQFLSSVYALLDLQVMFGVEYQFNMIRHYR